jgi:hypothetical protein
MKPAWVSTHGMRKQMNEDPGGVHHRNDREPRPIHDRCRYQARGNLLVDPFRVGWLSWRVESRVSRDYSTGALSERKSPHEPWQNTRPYL